MKRIIKGNEPASFIQFKQENERAGIRVYYNTHLGQRETEAIKNSLLVEQGYICAYTLKKINLESCHIEHLKPEGLCRKQMAEGIETVSDLDYSNMVACYPKESTKGISDENYFGAIKKGNTWINDGKDYILPLHSNCEDHFKYDKSGGVLGITHKGKTTVSLLALDHKLLVDERKNSIDAFIYIKNKAISKAKAIQALESIDKNENGRFREFCIPIKHALIEHLAFLEKLERKLKFARKK